MVKSVARVRSDMYRHINTVRATVTKTGKHIRGTLGRIGGTVRSIPARGMNRVRR